MKASEKLITHIKKSEGLRLTAYTDCAGVITIGYGHTKGVKKGDRITEKQALNYLLKDLQPIERWLKKEAWCDTQGKFDAVADFIFNLGRGRFIGSTLYKYILQGKETEAIQKEFKRWVFAGGKRLKGLEIRRAWEAERWTEKE